MSDRVDLGNRPTAVAFCPSSKYLSWKTSNSQHSYWIKWCHNHIMKYYLSVTITVAIIVVVHRCGSSFLLEFLQQSRSVGCSVSDEAWRQVFYLCLQMTEKKTNILILEGINEHEEYGANSATAVMATLLSPLNPSTLPLTIYTHTHTHTLWTMIHTL